MDLRSRGQIIPLSDQKAVTETNTVGCRMKPANTGIANSGLGTNYSVRMHKHGNTLSVR